MLNDMVKKGEEEKQAEFDSFGLFKTFCEKTANQKLQSIENADEESKTAKADDEKYTAMAAQLAQEIEGHNHDIDVWKGDLQAAVKVREMEARDYDLSTKEIRKQVDAAYDGIAKVKALSGDKGAVLLQAQASLTPELQAMLQTFQGEAPKAVAYESQTGGIIDMLTQLRRDFEKQAGDLPKNEQAAKNNYVLLTQSLNLQIDEASEATTAKSEAKADALQKAAAARGALGDAASTKKADSEHLTDLKSECEQKSQDFADRQNLRADEIVAINKAIEIMSGGAVSGASDKHLNQLLQSSSFAQLRSHEQNRHAMHERRISAAAYLRAQSVKFNSRVLAAIATRTSADPFKKVKKMIKDMIVKLMEEAGSEAEHKGFCDRELGTNKHTRQSKTEAVELLHADIDELEASTTMLTQQISDLTAAVATIDESVAKATNIRMEERAKNGATIADAKAAQEAVANALTVLNDFYAQASLVQTSVSSSDSGGVIAMLEVIQSDFVRLESETSAAEEAAASDYDKFMKDSKMDKLMKSQDAKHHGSNLQDQEQSMQEKKADLDGTSKELQAAMAYFEKLKPDCVETGVSYEDRVARRKEEMESLQTALRVLNGEE